MIAFAALVALSAPASGGGITGNGLKQLCESRQSRKDGDCFAYVTGAVDGFDVAQTVFAPPDSGQRVCIPAGGTYDQLTDVVNEYMARNPHQLHHPGGWIVAMAMKQAFPCN